MSRPTPHLTELDWSRHLAGEGGPLERLRRRRHLKGCPTCRDAYAQMLRERDAFEAEPARRVEEDRLAARAQSSAARPPREAPRWLALGSGLATASLAPVLVLSRLHSSGGLVAKGHDAFSVWVQRSDQAALLGSICHPGDRLTARYGVDHPHLLVLERDGSGAIQELFRIDPGEPSSLRSRAGTAPISWVLDDVPGEECFAGFFSDAPLDASAARQALASNPHAPALAGAVIRVSCCAKELRR